MSRNLILVLWRCGLEVLRAFGQEYDLCLDIQVIKKNRPGKVAQDFQTGSACIQKEY